MVTMEEQITESPTSKIKIAVLCLPGLESFLNEIVAWMQKRYSVRTCYGDDAQKIVETVAWSDVVWLEWANALAVGLTKDDALLKNKHVICRLHSYEAFEDDILAINWRMIDELICIAPHILDVVRQRVPGLTDHGLRTSTIANGIDLGRFGFKERRKGFNLAWLGYLNYKKGPMLLMQLLQKLVQSDARYRLHIGGQVQDQRYQLYLDQMTQKMGMGGHLCFDGWVDDVDAWLADKEYILSTSLLESQHLAVMEAMACGLKPVVHNFVGAEGIYPHDYLWNTIDEAVEQIQSQTYHSAEYRLWIEERYDLQGQLAAIESLIERCQLTKAGQHSGAQTYETQGVQSATASGGATGEKRSSLPGQKIGTILQRCVQPQIRVLDVGCGTGEISQQMAMLGGQVTAIDPFAPAIETALVQNSHPGITYQVMPYDRMEMATQFDLITLVNTLNAIPEDELGDFIAGIARIASSRAVVYVHAMDGRFLRYAPSLPGGDKATHISHLPETLLSAFARQGFHAYHIELYGDSHPLQYNDFLFATQNVIEGTFRSLS